MHERQVLNDTVGKASQAGPVLRRLRDYIESSWPDLAGPDPYDALNSPFIRRITGRQRHLRIAWIQLLRQLPWDLRPIVGVPPHRNPKTISLLARAYTRLASGNASPSGEARNRAETCLDWLAAEATSGYSGAAWGYSFPWQSSRLWLDRGEPSSVCTAFVAQAFLDAFDAWGNPSYLEIARSATRFLVNDCPRYETPTRLCISYTPSAMVTVHNANILAATILARVWRATGGSDRELARHATKAVAYTLAEQRDDGAWYYDGPPGLVPPLVDGFHTGFVLEGLDRIAQALGADYSAEISRGLGFYQRRLIEINGQPRRSEHRSVPVDIRDCAQALLVLDRFSGCSSAVDQRSAVERWTLSNMLDPQGYFYFQHGARVGLGGRLPYPRWQAWMLLALAAGDQSNDQ